MQAIAAETGQAAQAVPFYADTSFWVAVAFILLMVLAGKKVFRVIGEALDTRSAGIKAQIEEATRLHEEAKELLASYERKQREASSEAEAIVAQARDEAERLEKRAAEELERSVKRREAQAMDRIAQAEAQAKMEVRAEVVELATKAAEQILRDKATGAKADALIDGAIKELSGKLH